MNGLKNQVQLIGNLGDNPQSKDFSNGKTKAWFPVATNETYYDSNGEKNTNTQWHNIVAWGKTAEKVNQYLEKGAQVMIEGRLNARSYEKDGEKRSITEIVINEFMMLNSNKKN